MNKRLAVFALVAVLVALPAAPAFAGNVVSTAAVFYDPDPDGIVLANLLANLAAHFAADIEMIPMRSYVSGDLARFDASLYAGTDYDATIPQAFLDDAATGVGPIMWMGSGLHQYIERHGKPVMPAGIQYVGWRAGMGLDAVSYKDRLLSRTQDTSFELVRVSAPAEVISYLVSTTGGVDPKPHCVRTGSFYYVSDNPLYFVGADERFWGLADMLHLLFGSTVPEQRRAMVRLEDLSAGSVDPATLRTVADGLEARGVPFSFGVIPVYLDPLGTYNGGVPQEAHIGDAPDFVDGLDYMLDRGGYLIMHGITHQHGDEISGDGWEFLDGDTLGPLAEDSAEWVRDRIEWGLAEFEAAGFRPRMWETPHYGASLGTYFVVGEFFDVQYERQILYDVPQPDGPVWGYTGETISTYFPYTIDPGGYGPTILPETLGYYCPGCGGEVADILAGAEAVSVIRDGVASFFFHPAVYDPSVLFSLVDELQARGFEFVGPSDLTDIRVDPSLDDDDDTGDDDDDDDDDPSGDDDDGGSGCF